MQRNPSSSGFRPEATRSSVGFPSESGAVKAVGLDIGPGCAKLTSAKQLTDKWQTLGNEGAQSEGPWIAGSPGYRRQMRLPKTHNGFRPASISHLRDRGVRWLVGPGLFL